MLFVIGYTEGDEVYGCKTADGADAVCQLDSEAFHATDGNISLVLVNPRIEYRFRDQWVATTGERTAVIFSDFRRPYPRQWSGDNGQTWESQYHAIERAFSD